jgi:mannitol/fructose-specific phosphotransferase system IIA component (Ntr-type)
MSANTKPIFSPQHLLFNVNVKNIKEAFTVIAKKAKELGVTNNIDELVNGFIKREKVSTTGMTESFAIPHTMSAEINFPAIIIAKFKQGID